MSGSQVHTPSFRWLSGSTLFASRASFIPVGIGVNALESFDQARVGDLDELSSSLERRNRAETPGFNRGPSGLAECLGFVTWPWLLLRGCRPRVLLQMSRVLQGISGDVSHFHVGNVKTIIKPWNSTGCNSKLPG